MAKTVPVEGIWLRYVGGENDPNAKVTVEVEIGGEWYEVIREAHGAAFSHCVSASGIVAAMGIPPLSEDSATRLRERLVAASEREKAEAQDTPERTP